MDQIENFTQMKVQQLSRLQGRIEEKIITIPVVIHIIYSNELENISDDQIQSQIDVLNEDFRKVTPYLTDKWSQAADTKIEFQLALVDPEGNSTKGITRKSSTVTSWSSKDLMKSSKTGGVDPWNTLEYLNIWVCNIEGGILGYAQYPGGRVSTDGVVISPNYFGSSDKGSNFYLTKPFDKGRTATHEVGHFLNLRHIWGNNKSCGSDDFVTDTPRSNGPNYGCQQGVVSCGSEDMTENFMDYSDDACMSVFTSGQKARMHALFQEGGFRYRLARSNKFYMVPHELKTPKDLVTLDIKPTEAYIAWKKVKGVCYDIRYRVTGTEFWNQTSVTGSSVVVKDLKDASEYEIQVRSTSSLGSSVFSDSLKFTTLNKDPYCVSNGKNPNEIYIGKFTLGSINNVSDREEKGYSNFTSLSTKLIKTHQSNFEITPVMVNDFDYKIGYAVFIDYNQDNDFDDEGELVYTKEKTREVFIEGNFIVPDSAKEGETRMRVAIKYNDIPEACEVYDYGEVEDYTVAICRSNSDIKPLSKPENLKVVAITEKEITVSWDIVQNNAGIKGYDVYLNDEFVKLVKEPLIVLDDLESSTTHKISIKTVDFLERKSEFSEISVTTLPEEYTYCESKGNKTTYEWIDKVEIGEISNYTKSDNGYGDYTHLEANVIKGDETPIVLSAGFLNFSYTEFWSVWIDFNQNGSFEDGEQVLSGSSSNGESLYKMIQISGDALSGKTRMRVSMKFNAEQTPCESFSEGEVEDYTLNILEKGVSGQVEEADVSNASVLGDTSMIKVTVYPNPTTEHINVTLHEKQKEEIVSYQIINSMGQVVQKEKMSDCKIDVSTLSLGMYTLEFDDGQKKFQTKIVKK